MKEEVRGHFLGQENILSDIGNREKQEQKEWEWLNGFSELVHVVKVLTNIYSYSVTNCYKNRNKVRQVC